MPKKMDRREFLKTAGATGLGVAAGGLLAPAAQAQTRRDTGKSAMFLRGPRMDRVRFGMIGVGARGSGHVDQLLMIEGAEVKAVCDNHAPTAEASKRFFDKRSLPQPDLYTRGDTDYRQMLERDDIDAVVISTPWDTHAKMAVDAMRAGKHAFIEVPAAVTVDECWDLVDTCERTQKHCMMMENVCYGREELMVWNMCRLGVFGELLHGEAAYIHDLRGQMHEIERGTGSWRTLEYTRRNGNLYPTHGLGPVCQYMDINHGDRMDYMSSVSSPSRVRALYAREKFPAGHSRRSLRFVCGDINTSIVKTVRGRSIMIQWDEQLPRPYNRLNLIQGTRGVWGGFPDRVVIEGETKSTHSWTEKEGLKAIYDKYDHPLWKMMGDEARRAGGHGGMDFIMLWRMVYCLRNGLPLDQDVYDAASWSVIGPLSDWSVANRSQSVDIPDFTRGKWRTAKPIELHVAPDPIGG